MDPEKHKQELVTNKNHYFSYLLNNQKIYLLVTMLVVLLIPIVRNLSSGKLPLMGIESYYHLQKAMNSHNIFYRLLHFLDLKLPDMALAFLPLIVAIITLLIIFYLLKRLHLQENLSFIFVAMMIFTPAFILAYTTISTSTIFLLLVALGFLLITFNQRSIKYLSIVPFILATQFDLVTSILMVLILTTNFIFRREDFREKKFYVAQLVIVIAVVILTLFLYNQQLFGDAYLIHNSFSDLISDLGGWSGVSFFVFLLSLIGLALLWKSRKLTAFYALLPVLIVLYIFTPHALLPLSLLIVFLAAVGFTELFSSTWLMKTLKHFTFLLLILGIIFSTMTYIDRMDQQAYTINEFQALQWVNDNYWRSAVIFTSLEHHYFVEYHSGRKTISEDLNGKGILGEVGNLQQRQENLEIDTHLENESTSDSTITDLASAVNTNSVFKATYIDELFPVLERNQVTLLFLTPEIISELPEDVGLLFLLKNEHFNLVYNENGIQIWEFQ